MKLQTLKPRVPMQAGRFARPVDPSSWRSGKGSTARGYGYAWQKRREAQLSAEPMCAYCARQGFVTPATVADHITPHRGDAKLFAGPLQSLCAACHSSAKAKEEAAQAMKK